MFSVSGLFLLLAAAGYCFRGHQGGDLSIQKKSAVPPGILSGVTYNYSSGMIARADFAITLSPEAILEASYYPALDSDTEEDEEWDAFAAFVEEIDLEDQLYGRTEKPACTLYYSDGKQQQKKLDQETAKQIRAYLTEMALRLLEEQE